MYLLCVSDLLVQWSFAALFTILLSLMWHKTASEKHHFFVYGFPAGEGRDTTWPRSAKPSCPPPKHRPVFVTPCTSCSNIVGREQGQTAELPLIFSSCTGWEVQSSNSAHRGSLSAQIISGLWAVPPPVVENTGHDQLLPCQCYRTSAVFRELSTGPFPQILGRGKDVLHPSDHSLVFPNSLPEWNPPLGYMLRIGKAKK